MKKLFIRLFPNWFNTCVHYEYDFSKEEKQSGLNIAIADETNKSLHKALALSDTKCEELKKACRVTLIKNDFLHDAIDEVIKNNVNHANELVYAVLIIGEMLNAQKQAQAIVQIIRGNQDE